MALFLSGIDLVWGDDLPPTPKKKHLKRNTLLYIILMKSSCGFLLVDFLQIFWRIHDDDSWRKKAAVCVAKTLLFRANQAPPQFHVL